MSFFIIFVIVTSLGVEGGLTHASESQQLVYHLQHPQELFCSADFGKRTQKCSTIYLVGIKRLSLIGISFALQGVSGDKSGYYSGSE